MFEHQTSNSVARDQMRTLLYAVNIHVPELKWLPYDIQHTTQHDIARLLCPITVFIDCVKETEPNNVANGTNHDIELDIGEFVQHHAT